MPVSKRSRGRAFEFWVRDWCREHGAAVHVCGRKAVYMREKLKDGKPGALKLMTKGDDIFGCDLIALYPFHAPLFIQATKDKSIKKRLEEIKKYPWNTLDQYVKVQLWQQEARAKVKIYSFNGKDLVETARIINRKLFLRG